MPTCFLCDGTGIYKKPLNQERYEEVFDRYDDCGQFSMDECRRKALDETGYNSIECPSCKEKGTIL